MKMNSLRNRGFSLVELMIAMGIGLFLVGAAISVYFAQTQTYKTTNSQASIQNAENAISALVTPLIREAGFAGCGSLKNSTPNLKSGLPPPLGSLSPSSGSNAFVFGYEATATSPLNTPNALTLPSDNYANDATLSDWSPALDASLASMVEKGSDVLVLLGGVPNTDPISVTSNVPGAANLDVQTVAALAKNQLVAVSNCVGTSVFKITSITGTTLNHIAGASAGDNIGAALAIDFQPGAQVMPLQQTAFFVAQGAGDQATLMMAVYSAGSWAVQPLVPGVEAFQVLYGTGAAGAITEYVSADKVANWDNVYALRLGFLLQGQTGSATYSTTAQSTFTLLGTPITVPADGRLRHVFEMTIQLRNAS